MSETTKYPSDWPTLSDFEEPPASTPAVEVARLLNEQYKRWANEHRAIARFVIDTRDEAPTTDDIRLCNRQLADWERSAHYYENCKWSIAANGRLEFYEPYPHPDSENG